MALTQGKTAADIVLVHKRGDGASRPALIGYDAGGVQIAKTEITFIFGIPQLAPYDNTEPGYRAIGEALTRENPASVENYVGGILVPASVLPPLWNHLDPFYVEPQNTDSGIRALDEFRPLASPLNIINVRTGDGAVVPTATASLRVPWAAPDPITSGVSYADAVFTQGDSEHKRGMIRASILLRGVNTANDVAGPVHVHLVHVKGGVETVEASKSLELDAADGYMGEAELLHSFADAGQGDHWFVRVVAQAGTDSTPAHPYNLGVEVLAGSRIYIEDYLTDSIAVASYQQRWHQILPGAVVIPEANNARFFVTLDKCDWEAVNEVKFRVRHGSPTNYTYIESSVVLADFFRILTHAEAGYNLNSSDPTWAALELDHIDSKLSIVSGSEIPGEINSGNHTIRFQFIRDSITGKLWGILFGFGTGNSQIAIDKLADVFVRRRTNV